jgi:hypothetical protein
VAAAHEQQQCGNCGALNPGDAVVCVVCGTVLSAYAPIPKETPPPPPAPDEKPAEPVRAPTATHATQRGSDWRELFQHVTDADNRPLDYLASTPASNKAEPPAAPVDPSTPTKPSDRGGDWRDLFAHTPGSERRGLDFSSLPAAPKLPDPPVVGKSVIPPPPATPNGEAVQEPETSLEQIQERAVEEPVVAQTPKATAPQGRRSIPAASLVPPVPDVISSRSAEIDRRLSNKSPQTMILYGIITFIAGCIVAKIFSTANVSSLLVVLVVLAAGLGGFVLLVLGFVLAMARREGRQR